MFDGRVFLDALFGWPLLQGALVAFSLAVAVQLAATALCLGPASAASSRRAWARGAVGAYVWLFRGAPTLLVLLAVWNGLPQLIPALRADWYTPFLVAFLALTSVQVAYSTEVMRVAFASVPPGQREAAAALGLHRLQAFRLVVLPQALRVAALRVAVPPLMNEFISPLKATSLATVNSLRELMTVTSYAISASFRFLEWYVAVLIYHLGMVSVLTVLQRGLEARLSAGHRR